MEIARPDVFPHHVLHAALVRAQAPTSRVTPLRSPHRFGNLILKILLVK
jgi:hypothetical protein